MTRQEAKRIILSEFISEFNETTPVNLTNQDEFYLCTSPLTPVQKPSDAPWVRFMVMNTTTVQRTLGLAPARRWRRYGMITAMIFVPDGEGTKRGDALCEEICNIFEGERIQNINFEQCVYEEIANNNGWFQWDLTIYWWFDESK